MFINFTYRFLVKNNDKKQPRSKNLKFAFTFISCSKDKEITKLNQFLYRILEAWVIEYINLVELL